MKLEFYFKQSEWSAETNVYIVLTDHNGERRLAKTMDLVFEPILENKSNYPSLKFSNEMSIGFFPALVDGLAKAGYKYESSDAGEIKAMRVHLEDMRKLVFKY